LLLSPLSASRVFQLMPWRRASQRAAVPLRIAVVPLRIATP
jgi:hypothetical protein